MKVQAAVRERWVLTVESPGIFMKKQQQKTTNNRSSVTPVAHIPKSITVVNQSHARPIPEHLANSAAWSSPAFPVSNVSLHSQLRLHAGESQFQRWKGDWVMRGWPKLPSLLKFIACAVGPCIFSHLSVSLTNRFICTSPETMLPLLLISCSAKTSQ